MRRLALILTCAALSCHTGSANTMTGAVVMSSLALGASAANRAAGGCYAVCQQGEACNEQTGLCEVLPCRGKCAIGESCEEGFFGIKCVPGPALSVSTASTGAKTLPPPPPPPEEKKPDKPQVPDAARP
ncbi:MAG: hypothetical protein ACXWLM_01530 [Myxococcales bacterium]